jgi:hypothetical protein
VGTTKGREMKTSTGTPTKAQKLRYERMTQLGCVCCRIMGDPERDAEIHHIVEGRKRLGHEDSIALCGWHHRGLKEDFWSQVPDSEVNEVRGPSIANGKRAFNDHWGSEKELLGIQNEMIREMFGES